MKLDRPLLFFDLETTGIEVEEDRIIEIACLKVFPDRTQTDFESLVNPGRPIPPEVTELTGISDEHVANAPAFEELADQLTTLLHDADLAGYNAVKFDLPFLRKEFERIGRPFPAAPGQVVVDAFEILRKHEPRSLSWSLKYYLNRELPEAHRAMADVNATADIMREQILRYELRGSPEEIVTKLRHPYLDSGRRLKIENGNVVICFGRNKGLTLKRLTETDPSYIVWMRDNMDPEVVEILSRYVQFPEAEADGPPPDLAVPPDLCTG